MAKITLTAEIFINDLEYIRLIGFERFDDGSGWRTIIAVGAGEFICTGRDFYFNEPLKFLNDLTKCHRELNGSAELKTQFEEEFLRFSFDGLGHVFITGLIRDYGGDECYFRYGIGTDQTSISGFLKSFDAALTAMNQKD